jgi:hypothetical protein
LFDELVELCVGGSDFLACARGHQTSDRQRQHLGHAFGTARRGQPATGVHDQVHRGGNVAIVHANCDHVMRIVCDAGSHRPAPQAQVFDKRDGRRCLVIAVYNHELQNVEF